MPTGVSYRFRILIKMKRHTTSHELHVYLRVDGAGAYLYCGRRAMRHTSRARRLMISMRRPSGDGSALLLGRG